MVEHTSPKPACDDKWRPLCVTKAARPGTLGLVLGLLSPRAEDVWGERWKWGREEMAVCTGQVSDDELGTMAT